MVDVDAMADAVVLAMKSALVPVQARLEAVQAQIAIWEARWADVGALRERVAVVEAKSLVPPVELHHEAPDAAVGEIRAGLATLTADHAASRERLAVLETRAPLPGPPGHDGVNGKDGADGLGFDDLAVEFDGDRTLALKFARGDQQKTWPIALPFLRYQGVYQQGKTYDVGDTVTWAGQLWHCREATITPPGDASKLWQLCVRKGRDGKDGRDAPGALPVVSVGHR